MRIDSEELYHSILGSVYWKNLDGVYLGANEYALKMVGLDHVNQLMAKMHTAIKPPSTMASTSALLFANAPCKALMVI